MKFFDVRNFVMTIDFKNGYKMNKESNESNFCLTTKFF